MLNNSMNVELKMMLTKFPFLTLAKYGKNDEYVGIVQNQDGNLISMYVYGQLKSAEDKQTFIDYGNEWWWGTNRMIPINIIFGKKFAQFKPILRTFNTKEFNVVYGPTVCLKNIMQKRVKRRNIQLVRRIP
jgi:hypothetical protein